MPLTDQSLYDHLAGRHTIGVYPLLADDDSYFLAVDFDGAAAAQKAPPQRSVRQSRRASAGLAFNPLLRREFHEHQGGIDHADFEFGLARAVAFIDDCGHDYFAAFSCEGRGSALHATPGARWRQRRT